MSDGSSESRVIFLPAASQVLHSPGDRVDRPDWASGVDSDGTPTNDILIGANSNSATTRNAIEQSLHLRRSARPDFEILSANSA
jgi:hypothetical protein